MDGKKYPSALQFSRFWSVSRNPDSLVSSSRGRVHVSVYSWKVVTLGLATTIFLTDGALRAASLKPWSAPSQSQTVADTPQTRTELACRWWQRGQCVDHEHPEGFPPDASRIGTVITVDTERNVLYLFRDGQLVAKSPAATGMDKVLTQGSRQWLFRTPRGRVTVLRKITDPIWTKPDWAFVEEGKAIPPKDSAKRKVAGKLGKYALDLGDGILIHGTDDPRSLGRKASHGCIRLPDDMLETVFTEAAIGTEVYVF